MVALCLETDGLGFEIFNVSNDDHSVDLTSKELHSEFYEGVPLADGHGERETFYSNAKAKRMLGFQPQQSWRTHLRQS